MIIAWLKDHLDILIKASTFTGIVVSSAVVIYKKGIKKLMQAFDQYVKDRKENAEHRAKTTLALKELLPNGGGSIKDDIKKIATNIEMMSEDVYIIKGRQSAMLHELPMPMFECDANGSYIDVNRSWIKMTGLSKDDAIGDGWIKIVSPDFIDQVNERWDNFIASGLNFNEKFKMVNNTNPEISYIIHVTAKKTFNIRGEVASIIGSVSRDRQNE